MTEWTYLSAGSSGSIFTVAIVAGGAFVFAANLIEPFVSKNDVPHPGCLNRSDEFGLERENFRIDSSDWKTATLADGTRIKINPRADAIEILDHPNRGEQLFTWAAAMRETSKAGRLMPSASRWIEIIRSATPDGTDGHYDRGTIRETLGIPLVGHADEGPNAILNSGCEGYYWAASENKSATYVLNAKTMATSNVCHALKNYAFSVRCLQG